MSSLKGNLSNLQTEELPNTIRVYSTYGFHDNSFKWFLDRGYEVLEVKKDEAILWRPTKKEKPPEIIIP